MDKIIDVALILTVYRGARMRVVHSGKQNLELWGLANDSKAFSSERPAYDEWTRSVVPITVLLPTR